MLDNDTMTMMARPRCGIPDVTLGDMDINRFGGVDEDLPDTGCFLNVPDVTRSAHPLLMLLMLCFLFNATELNKTWSFTSSTGGILWSLLVRLLRFVPKGASNRTCGSRLGRRLVISS